MKRMIARGGSLLDLLVPLLLGAYSIAILTGMIGGRWLPAAAVVAAGVWLARTRVVSRGMRRMAMASDLLSSSDFSSRLRPVGHARIDPLIEVFNRMNEQLLSERLKLSERHFFMLQLMEAIPVAVEIYNYQGDTVAVANQAARRIVTPEVRHLMEGMVPGECRTLRLSTSKIYKCSLLTFKEDGVTRRFSVVEPVTEEIRKAERQAFEKVIRLIAHEVNNTVGSLVTMVDMMAEEERARPDGGDGDMIAALESCSARSRWLTRFLQEYVDLVKLPALNCSATDPVALVEAMEPFLRGVCAAIGRNISFAFPEAGERPSFTAMIDATKFEPVIVNIVKNAAESCCYRSDGLVEISFAREDVGEGRRMWCLTVTDNGRGISEEVASQLFTPFFSTKESGRGLGLMYVAQVLGSHGFDYSLTTEEGLTRFRIWFGRLG